MPSQRSRVQDGCSGWAVKIPNDIHYWIKRRLHSGIAVIQFRIFDSHVLRLGYIIPVLPFLLYIGLNFGFGLTDCMCFRIKWWEEYMDEVGGMPNKLVEK